MKCPICTIDLEPLDLVSRTEHVELCVDNKVVEVSENGQLFVKSNLPPAKQRKICPICDKTFQTIASHFKNCALKNDVPPYLMLDYWDRINKDVKNPKKFPRDLLDNFIAKCLKEGRLGEQLELAKALLISISDGDPIPSLIDETSTSTTSHRGVDVFQTGVVQDETSESTSNTEQAQEAGQVLMQRASVRNAKQKTAGLRSRAKQYRIELVDETTKHGYIQLRIDRELAATRKQRYEEALRREAAVDRGSAGEECLIIEEEQDKLFHRARLKACNGSDECKRALCSGHELVYFVEGFEVYSGRSMENPEPASKQQHNIETESEVELVSNPEA